MDGRKQPQTLHLTYIEASEAGSFDW
jgi:hypothetical protein